MNTVTAAANSTKPIQEDHGIINNSPHDVIEIKTEIRESPARSSTETEDESADGTTSCPLFMDSLPSNFASNAGLAAIASLLNEVSDNDNDNTEREKPRTSEIKVTAGGGKTTKRRTGMGRHSPYKSPNNGKNDAKKQTTVGEAQLFLSMWRM
jgi:hypothetical protein